MVFLENGALVKCMVILVVQKQKGALVNVFVGVQIKAG